MTTHDKHRHIQELAENILLQFSLLHCWYIVLLSLPKRKRLMDRRHYA